MWRRLLTLVLLAWLVVSLGTFVFWARSLTRTDVLMIPLGGQSELMLTSHQGGWLEITMLKQWPEARVGFWSGYGWENVGPFKFWQISRYSRKWGIDYVEGQLICPRASSNGPPAYIGSYRRAEVLGYPGPIAWGSPDWFLAVGNEARIPFNIVVAAAWGFFIVLLVTWLEIRHRCRRRYGAGLCPNCGYDLRATPARCPECGHVVGNLATDKN